MSREIAERILGYLPSGTFLVRLSVSTNLIDKLALSLR